MYRSWQKAKVTIRVEGDTVILRSVIVVSSKDQLVVKYIIDDSVGMEIFK